MDVSVSESVLSPPCEHLAFSSIVFMHRQILVAVEEVSGTNQHSNEEPNVWRSEIVQLVQLYTHVVQERCGRKAKFLFSPILCSANESRYLSSAYL